MSSLVSGFMGVIGSGKNYQADILIKQGFKQIDFKDELCRMASDLLGYDIREHYDFFKEHAIGIRCPNSSSAMLLYIAHETSKTAVLAGVPTGRVFLQRLGTDVIRSRHPNYWVDAWTRQAIACWENDKPVAVADVRFENEALTILKKDSSALRFCDYRSSRYDAAAHHESEALAQALLKIGLGDGDFVDRAHLTEAAPIAAALAEQYRKEVI